MSTALLRFPLSTTPAALVNARRRRPAVHAPAGWRCGRATGPAPGGGGGSVVRVECVGENRRAGGSGYGGAVVGEDVEVASIGTLGVQGLSLFLLLFFFFFTFCFSMLTSV